MSESRCNLCGGHGWTFLSPAQHEWLEKIAEGR